VGFAGPVGLQCTIVADHDIPSIVNAVTGANEKDAHLTGVNRGRDYQLETTDDLRMAEDGDPCPKCEGRLQLVHGIEVGHVFKLGTKYSESLDALFLDENEQRHPMIMGCYGIGVNRIVAGLAETSHDENGLIWPLAVAPYEVLLIPLNLDDEQVVQTAERFYAELTDAGVEVLIDDRKARPGFKFKDADLIGIPLRIVVGSKGVKQGEIEIKWRSDADPQKIAVDRAIATVQDMLAARRSEEAAKADDSVR